jgi:hypothetical protein
MPAADGTDKTVTLRDERAHSAFAAPAGSPRDP